MVNFYLFPVYVDRNFDKAEINDCAYVYKIKNLTKIDAEFFKLVFLSLRENNKLKFVKFLK